MFLRWRLAQGSRLGAVLRWIVRASAPFLTHEGIPRVTRTPFLGLHFLNGHNFWLTYRLLLRQLSFLFSFGTNVQAVCIFNIDGPVMASVHMQQAPRPFANCV